MAITGQLDRLDGSLSTQWDPQDPPPPKYDGGWIGEDSRGVWLKIHPETALLENPAVATLYERMRLRPEMLPADVDTFSAWEHTLASHYVAAHNRRVDADVRPGK